MVERRQPNSSPELPVVRRRLGGNYFPEARKSLTFISSGCTLLDCVLGGGWPLGRISNIVGDKSTGKTLLAIEACANFARQFPKGNIWYRESEAAFDEDYAEKLGLPVDRVDFGSDGLETAWETVEDIFEDLDKQLDKAGNKPGLYIVDSLDALTDRSEQKRKIDQGSFGTQKAKLMSEILRRSKRKIKATNTHLMIISQVRHKIGVLFGEKLTRAGGDALHFYASQELWLSHLKTLMREIRGQKRATGVRILAKCKKNKIAQPFNTCEFKIRFGFGVDDLEASLEWLEAVNMLKRLTNLQREKYLERFEDLEDGEMAKQLTDLKQVVRAAWYEIENQAMPARRKYV